jgi:hypothetical protein
MDISHGLLGVLVKKKEVSALDNLLNQIIKKPQSKQIQSKPPSNQKGRNW